MASAAQFVFYGYVVNLVNIVLLFVVMALAVIAFVSCARQRAEVFPVVGPLSKVVWLSILGSSVVFSYLCYAYRGMALLIWSAAVAASLVFLLDVRPAIREAVEGHGPW